MNTRDVANLARTRERAAYHEAGHAVIGLMYFGCVRINGVESISIDCSGNGRVALFEEPNPESRWTHARWVLAGFAAEWILVGSVDAEMLAGSALDLAQAHQLLEGDEGALVVHLDTLRRTIRDRWAEVEAIAQELIRYGSCSGLIAAGIARRARRAP